LFFCPQQQSPWTGPVSRELLVFNSFVRSLSRSLRSLLEATAFNLVLRGDSRRAREDYLDIALSLPFQSDTNTGMGILCKAYCDAVTVLSQSLDREALGNEQGRPIKEQAAGMLDPGEGKGLFANVRGVRAELERGFRFWDVVRAVLPTTHRYTFFFPFPPSQGIAETSML
jgi:Temperature dependent protein affecting M2 dsRNA replication